MTAVRAILRVIGSVLLVSGALLLLDAGLTLAWQEPVSALMATRSQAVLDDQLERELAAVARDDRQPVLVRGRVAMRAAADRYARRLRTGRGIGRISMPALGRRYAMVHGTDTRTGVACVTGRKRRTALLEAESHERRVTSIAGRPTANVIVDLGAGRPYQAKAELVGPGSRRACPPK